MAYKEENNLLKQYSTIWIFWEEGHIVGKSEKVIQKYEFVFYYESDQMGFV